MTLHERRQSLRSWTQTVWVSEKRCIQTESDLSSLQGCFQRQIQVEAYVEDKEVRKFNLL